MCRRARERLVVGARLRHQAAHDVVLALGERGDRALGRGRPLVTRQLHEQPPGRVAVEPELSFVYLLDRLDEQLRRVVLVHHAACAAQDGKLVLAVARAAQHQHARAAAVDQARNQAAVLLRGEVYVDHHDVGLGGGRDFDGARARRRGGDHAEIGFLIVDQPLQTGKNDPVRVHEHDSDAAVVVRIHAFPPAKIIARAAAATVKNSSRFCKELR